MRYLLLGIAKSRRPKRFWLTLKTKKMSKTKIITKFESVEEAKVFSLSEDVLGLMIKKVPTSPQVRFGNARCSSLEEYEEEAELLKQGNYVFILAREDKIKYFFLPDPQEDQIVSFTFVRQSSENWREFYEKTLTKVFGPEA